MDRTVWIEPLRSKDQDRVHAVVAAAIAAGFDQIVLGEPDESLQRLGRFSPILTKDDSLIVSGAEVGRRATIRSPKDEPAVRALRGKTKHVVVRTEDWKVIPLENLIAHFQGSGTRLMVQVADAAEAKLAFEAMEVGADGILLATSSAKEIHALRALLESLRHDVPLVRGTVTRVRPLGLGDRVCIDTCSLLRTGEGMLVGNSAAALFLIHGETVDSGYAAARPFRVNAGPVHAYVYMPDGSAKYLSELRAGDDVLAVDAQGRTRTVIVGRVKIERRPLVLVEAEAGGRPATTIVQNAETVRFVTPEGGFISVTDLKAGDLVLLRTEEGGRHFGMRIQETISER